jgi:uncharacterized protein (DUF427 family)
MVRATWNGVVVAEADATVVVEGNHYFPPDSVRFEFLHTTRARSLCFWKGVARYYDVVVNDGVSRGAAWSYAHPSPLARKIRGHIAFWNGVRVEVIETSRAPRAVR